MRLLVEQWYRGGLLSRLLAPLGYVYGCGMQLRRHLYRSGWLRAAWVPLPVVVVGNLSLGGTGKTPLVIALVDCLLRLGRRPAVVSRGYRSRSRWNRSIPLVVSDGIERRVLAADSGDEPAALADRLQVPVVVGADREAAVAEAVTLGADCVVADDGFQRLRLPRIYTFVVVDSRRGLGNGRCLPAGPLREPISALAEADVVVAQGGPLGSGLRPAIQMQLVPRALRALGDRGKSQPLEWLVGRRVHAVAGLGDPERFFETLKRLGANVVPYRFSDHHRYTRSDLPSFADGGLVTTEKDEVKLVELGYREGWVLEVDAHLEPSPRTWLERLP